MLAINTLIRKSMVFRREIRLMGNRFEIGIVSIDPNWADERIDDAIAEINRVEKLLGTFSDDSIVNEINRNAGIKPVKTDGEVYRLIDRSLKISELTHGAFDITYYTAVGDDDTFEQVTIKKNVVTNAGYKNVVLDYKSQTVFLKEKGMRIGFGANSKGYAADRAKYILQLQGVSNGIINAGGDLLTWGSQPDQQPWTIAAADPGQHSQPYAHIDISNMAIATSLNTEKITPFIHKKNFSTVSAKKGFHVSGIKSASIISTCAELADAMATPIISIGINAGVYQINQLNQIACIIIDDNNRIYTSKGIHIPLA